MPSEPPASGEHGFDHDGLLDEELNLPIGARNIADLLEQAQQEQFNFQPADLDLLASR